MVMRSELLDGPITKLHKSKTLCLFCIFMIFSLNLKVLKHKNLKLRVSCKMMERQTRQEKKKSQPEPCARSNSQQNVENVNKFERHSVKFQCTKTEECTSEIKVRNKRNVQKKTKKSDFSGEILVWLFKKGQVCQLFWQICEGSMRGIVRCSSPAADQQQLCEEVKQEKRKQKNPTVIRLASERNVNSICLFGERCCHSNIGLGCVLRPTCLIVLGGWRQFFAAHAWEFRRERGDFLAMGHLNIVYRCHLDGVDDFSVWETWEEGKEWLYLGLTKRKPGNMTMERKRRQLQQCSTEIEIEREEGCG